MKCRVRALGGCESRGGAAAELRFACAMIASATGSILRVSTSISARNGPTCSMLLSHSSKRWT
jgi:hypothetical protein